MSRLAVNGLHLNVDSQGAGPALVMLHGFSGSSLNWQPLVPALAEHFQVILIDLPGHGRSDSPADPVRYSLPETARDIAAALEQLGVSRTNLLGYSMGGRTALYFALNYPELVSRLVLESASPGLETEAERAERRQADEALAGFIETRGVPAFVQRWESMPLFASQQQLPEATRQKLRRQRLKNNPAGLANSLRGAGTGAQPSLWPALPDLQRPVLLLAGRLDGKFCDIARRMRELLPCANLEIVEGAGHTIHLERPQEYTRLVLNFLNEGQPENGAPPATV